MPVGEIIMFTIALFCLATMTWKLIYLNFIKSSITSNVQESSMNMLKSILNKSIRGINTNSTVVFDVENLKKIKMQKSKILNKLNKLIQLISDKTGVTIKNLSLYDPLLQESFMVKVLDEEESQKFNILTESSSIKLIISNMISEDIYPTQIDFNYINGIYKQFLKRNDIK